MSAEANIASTAFLIGDNARAAMLTALADGRALPAGELAHVAGVTAQTASAHLAKLIEGGLLAVEREGRHRYYRLAGPHVAAVLETLAAVPAATRGATARTPRDQSLRLARCCYDHLAGQLGVAITKNLVARGFLTPDADKRFAVTAAGAAWFAELGLDTTQLKPARRGLARQCLDWTEREHHIAGPLGDRLLTFLCSKNWLRRTTGRRALAITASGYIALRTHFDISMHA